MILYGLVLTVHILLALFLIIIVLLQGGRGGLGETLGGAAAQSLFGGGANTVMTRLTTICAGLFMVTSLTMAILSTARGRSIMEQLQDINQQQFPGGLPFPPASQEPEEPSPEAAPASQSAAPPESASPAPAGPAAQNASPASGASKKTE